MNTVHAYFDGNVFVPVEPIKLRRNQKAIVNIIEDDNKAKARMRFFGIMPQSDYEDFCEALKDTEKIDNEW